MKNPIHNFVISFSIDNEKYADLLLLIPHSDVRKFKDKIIEMVLKESVKQMRNLKRN